MRGSVRKIGATWSYTVDRGVDPATGKRRQQLKRGFSTRKKAETALAEVLAGANAGGYVEPSGEPLGEYLERWLASMQATVAASTWHGYAQKLRSHVIPRIGAIPLSLVDAVTLNTMYSDLRASGGKDERVLSARTVGHVHKILHRALRDAVRWDLLTRNPADLADPPRPQPVRMSLWTADQLHAFLEHQTDDRLFALWALAVATGMRRGEIAGLRWDAVDLTTSRVTVERARVLAGYEVIEKEPKSGRSRVVALDPETVAVLRQHRKRQLEERLAWGEAWIDTGYVFTREDGEPLHPMSISEAFERRVAGAGLPHLRLHDLRHLHATLGLAAGVPVKVMQERLGHANIAITLDLYTQVVDELHDDAAVKVASLIYGGNSARS